MVVLASMLLGMDEAEEADVWRNRALEQSRYHKRKQLLLRLAMARDLPVLFTRGSVQMWAEQHKQLDHRLIRFIVSRERAIAICSKLSIIVLLALVPPAQHLLLNSRSALSPSLRATVSSRITNSTGASIIPPSPTSTARLRMLANGACGGA